MLCRSTLVALLLLGITHAVVALDQSFALSVTIELLAGTGGARVDAIGLEMFGQEYLYTFNDCAGRAANDDGIRLSSVQFDPAERVRRVMKNGKRMKEVSLPATIFGYCPKCTSGNGEIVNLEQVLYHFARPCGRPTTALTSHFSISKMVSTIPTRQAMTEMASIMDMSQNEMEDKLVKDSDERMKRIENAIQKVKRASTAYLPSASASPPNQGLRQRRTMEST